MADHAGMLNDATSATTEPASSIVAYSKWLNEVGKSPSTGERWIRQGWIETFKIANKRYVDREKIRKFESRAKAGEFAEQPSGAAKRSAGAKVQVTP